MHLLGGIGRLDGNDARVGRSQGAVDVGEAVHMLGRVLQHPTLSQSNVNIEIHRVTCVSASCTMLTPPRIKQEAEKSSIRPFNASGMSRSWKLSENSLTAHPPG